MKFVCCLIAVSDMQRSRDFYENLLEQKVKYDFGENITFHGDFAIHLASHFQKLIDNKEIQQGNNFELYFENDQPDIIAERLRKHGVQFVHEIKEQPWRQRVFRFYDPDNHIVEVGESMPFLVSRLSCDGLSVEEIISATGLTRNFVFTILEDSGK